jgi:hypothetical protein
MQVFFKFFFAVYYGAFGASAFSYGLFIRILLKICDSYFQIP